MSCICVNLEKQIVFLAKRLIRVLSVRCFLSIFWVFLLPTSCCSGVIWRWYAPQLSVKNLLIPKGSRRLFSSKNTLSVCLLTYMPTPFLLYGQSHAIAIFDYFCFLQNSTSIHFWPSILSILISIFSTSSVPISLIFTFSITDSFF